MQDNFGNREDRVYAGFWVRLGAYLIDMTVVWAGLLIVRLGIALAGSGLLDGEVLFRYTGKDILLYFFRVLYFVLLTYCTGSTLGKKLLNLRVTAKEGEKLSLFDVVYRETIGRFLSGILCIGYIMVGVEKEKCGFHDMLCDTRVIYAKKVKIYPELIRPAYHQGMPPREAVPGGMSPQEVKAREMPPREPSPRETPQGEAASIEVLPGEIPGFIEPAEEKKEDL